MNKFKTLEDIITHVESEAERRYVELMKKYGEDIQTGEDELERSILWIIRKQPVSASTISVMTGKPINLILHHLRRMEKWNLTEVVTKKETLYWGVPRNGKVDE